MLWWQRLRVLFGSGLIIIYFPFVTSIGINEIPYEKKSINFILFWKIIHSGFFTFVSLGSVYFGGFELKAWGTLKKRYFLTNYEPNQDNVLSYFMPIGKIWLMRKSIS